MLSPIDNSGVRFSHHSERQIGWCCNPSYHRYKWNISIYTWKYSIYYFDYHDIIKIGNQLFGGFLWIKA